MRRIAAVLLVVALAVPLVAQDKPKSRRITVPQFTLSATFAGLSVADTALTIYGTTHLGLREQNSMMRPFFEGRHYAALWAVQATGCAAILAGCHVLIHSDEKAGRIVGWGLLIAVNVGRAYIVYHNLRLHAKVR